MRSTLRAVRAAAAVLVLAPIIALLPAPAASAAPAAPQPRFFVTVTGTNAQGLPVYLVDTYGLKVVGAASFEIWRGFGTAARKVKTVAATTSGYARFGGIGGPHRVRALDSSGRPGAFSAVQIIQTFDPKRAWLTSYNLAKSRVSLAAYADAAKRFVADRAGRCAKDAAWDRAINQLSYVALRSRTAYGVAAGATTKFYKALYDATFANNCEQIKHVTFWAAEAAARTLFNSTTIPVNITIASNFENVNNAPDYCFTGLLTSGGGKTTYQRNVPMSPTQVSLDNCDEIARRFVNAPVA